MIKFECQQCGHCCQGEPGYVFISPEDIRRISIYLRLKPKLFLERYARRVNLPWRCEYSLNEFDDGRCVFFDNGCKIYPARPVQCSTFPFWPPYLKNVEEFQKLVRNCPGYGQGKSYNEDEIFEICNVYMRELMFDSGESRNNNE